MFVILIKSVLYLCHYAVFVVANRKHNDSDKFRLNRKTAYNNE